MEIDYQHKILLLKHRHTELLENLKDGIGG
jgi:hypothetical protein